MKKFLLATISLVFITSAAFAQRTSITKFDNQPITGIIAGGAFDIKIKPGAETGAETGVRVEVAAEVASKITIDLTDDGYVRLGYGSDLGKYFKSSKNRPTAYITMSSLDYLNVSGACNLIGSDTFRSAKPLVVSISGSAFCDAVNVTASEANITVSGASTLENLTITTEKLTAEVTGSAMGTIKGEAVQARLAVSGAAQFNALQLICPTIQAAATGTSLLKVNATGTVDVTTGGLAAIKYIGRGTITGSGTAKPLN